MEIRAINERAISTFCMCEFIEGSKEDLEQMFTTFLYIYNNEENNYEFVSRTKRIADHRHYSALKVYAIVRPKYSPPIVYRHLMDQWVRRSNPKRQKSLEQLTEHNSSNAPYAKGFADGFSIGYEKGVASQMKDKEPNVLHSN